MNTASSKIDFSLILPCYNEEKYLASSIQQIVSVLNSTAYSYEIIFVDDMSLDETRKIIDRFVASPATHSRRIFNKHNIGRGGTVMRGIRRAHGKWVGFIDIDLEVGAHYIPYCLASLAEGASVVTGLRIYKISLRGIFRHLASKCYGGLVRFLLKLPLHDTETGFKFFDRSAVLPLLSQVKETGWFWDTEIMARCVQHELTIIEKPCLFIRRHDKTSSVRLIRDSLRYLLSLLKNVHELRNINKKNHR
jgi:glycosyltransferase involved in cell wall biosynthesis